MRANTNPCSMCEYCDDSCDVCLHLPYELADPAFYREASSDEEPERDGAASTDADSDASDEDGSWFTTPWSKLIAQRVAGYEVDPAIGVELAPVEPHPDEEQEAAAEREEPARAVGKRRRKKGERGPEEETEEDGVESGRGARRLRRRRKRGSTPARVDAVEALSETVVEGQGDLDSVTADGETTEDAVAVLATAQQADNSETRSEDATDSARTTESTQRSDNMELRFQNASNSAESSGVPQPTETPSEIGVSPESVANEPRIEGSVDAYESGQHSGNSELKSEGAPDNAMRANGGAQAEFIQSTPTLANDEVQGADGAVPKDAHDSTWRVSVQSCVPLVSVS